MSAPSPFLDLTRRVQGASLARTRYVQRNLGHLVEVDSIRTERFDGGYGEPFLFRTIVTTTSWEAADALLERYLRHFAGKARLGDRTRRALPAAVLEWNPVPIEQLDLRPRS